MNEKLGKILIPVEIKLPNVFGLEFNMTLEDLVEIDRKYKAKGSLISLTIISLESALNECRKAQKNAIESFRKEV